MTWIQTTKQMAIFRLGATLMTDHGYPFNEVIIKKAKSGWLVDIGKRANMLTVYGAHLDHGTILILDEGTY